MSLDAGGRQKDISDSWIEVANDPVVVWSKKSYHSREVVAADLPRYQCNSRPAGVTHHPTFVSLTWMKRNWYVSRDEDGWRQICLRIPVTLFCVYLVAGNNINFIVRKDINVEKKGKKVRTADNAMNLSYKKINRHTKKEITGVKRLHPVIITQIWGT